MCVQIVINRSIDLVTPPYTNAPWIPQLFSVLYFSWCFSVAWRAAFTCCHADKLKNTIFWINSLLHRATAKVVAHYSQCNCLSVFPQSLARHTSRASFPKLEHSDKWCKIPVKYVIHFTVLGACMPPWCDCTYDTVLVHTWRRLLSYYVADLCVHYYQYSSMLHCTL